MKKGDFFFSCPASGRGLFGSLGRSFGRTASSERSTLERVDELIRKSSLSSANEHAPEDDLNGGALWKPGPATWRLGGGAVLLAHFGIFHVVGDLRRIQPSVYHDTEHDSICVFQGYLSNLDELSERYCNNPGDPWGSPTAVAATGKDPREAAAQVIHRMYSRGDDPLILLSELQGQYSFAMYDSERRQLFAARDSSGKEALYYDIADDGTVSASNARLSVSSPDGIAAVEWQELPPGHFIGGKSTPKVQQFALTPAQLSAREFYDTLEELSPHSSGRRITNEDFTDIGVA